MLDKENMDRDTARALYHALDLTNLGVIAPHKEKYYLRYDINWLINAVKDGTNLTYVTFWHEGEKYKNNAFSQWYKGNPFVVNGRSYVTAEQYMMSEKALLFNDFASYRKIMNEPDPAKCKKLGKSVTPFDGGVWDKAAREIVFHGTLGKLQANIEIVDALLSTDNSVLVEASPYDDNYGAGLEEKDLLNPDGTLKVQPWDWHKADSTKQSKNDLGFVLMGVRDLFTELMGYRYRPGMADSQRIGE